MVEKSLMIELFRYVNEMKTKTGVPAMGHSLKQGIEWSGKKWTSVSIN